MPRKALQSVICCYCRQRNVESAKISQQCGLKTGIGWNIWNIWLELLTRLGVIISCWEWTAAKESLKRRKPLRKLKELR